MYTRTSAIENLSSCGIFPLTFADVRRAHVEDAARRRSQYAIDEIFWSFESKSGSFSWLAMIALAVVVVCLFVFLIEKKQEKKKRFQCNK